MEMEMNGPAGVVFMQDLFLLQDPII